MFRTTINLFQQFYRGYICYVDKYYNIQRILTHVDITFLLELRLTIQSMVMTVSDLSLRAIVSTLGLCSPSLSPVTMVITVISVSPVPVPESASSPLISASPHRHSPSHSEQLSLLSHLNMNI